LDVDPAHFHLYRALYLPNGEPTLLNIWAYSEPLLYRPILLITVHDADAKFIPQISM